MTDKHDEQPRPPEAVLIATMRERAPRQSRKQAAAAAGISDTRWRDIENGYKYVMGQRVEVILAPARTVAKMAMATKPMVTPDQLRQAGRADAAAELEALLLDAEMLPTERQREAITDRIHRDTSA